MIFQLGDLEVLKQNDDYIFSNILGKKLNTKAYMSIVSTNKCNRNCPYCINSETDGISELPIEKALKNIKKAHDLLNIKECVILGGEPTCYKNLEKLVYELHNIGFEKIVMTSNGILLTKNLINSLINKGLTHLNVSVHTKERFDFCSTIGISDMKEIYKIVDHRIPVRVNTNIWKNNHDTLGNLITWLTDLQDCSDTIRVSNLIFKDSFSVNPKNNEIAKEMIPSENFYNELFDNLIEYYSERLTLIHNPSALGFVDYTMIPTKSAIIVNRNIDSKVAEQVCENDLKNVKVNTIKCLVNGELSLSWNNDNIIYL